MPFDALFDQPAVQAVGALLARIPPESRQPLILAAAGLLLLAFLQRGRGDRSPGPRPRAARWANRQDLRPLLADRPPPRGLLLGRHARAWVAVQPTAVRRELAHALASC